MSLRHLCGRDTFMCRCKSWLHFRQVFRGIRIHKQLRNAFLRWPSKSPQVTRGTWAFANTPPGEWLHLMQASGNIVCTEPVGGVAAPKRGVALGNLYSPISCWKRVGLLRQEGERGSEPWARAWWLQRESREQGTPFSDRENKQDLEHPARPLQHRSCWIYFSSLNIIVNTS